MIRWTATALLHPQIAQPIRPASIGESGLVVYSGPSSPFSLFLPLHFTDLSPTHSRITRSVFRLCPSLSRVEYSLILFPTFDRPCSTKPIGPPQKVYSSSSAPTNRAAGLGSRFSSFPLFLSSPYPFHSLLHLSSLPPPSALTPR